MRRTLHGRSLFLLAIVALGTNAACGKRADPLPPWVKTPMVPTAMGVAQMGDEIEIRAIAPRTTIEARPLPVIELEWLQAPAVGDFGKTAVSLLREEVAPGELRVHRFPRPVAPVRITVRAFAGKARSANAPILAFTPAVVPAVPIELSATNTATGVELRWINPPGAEPWPTPVASPAPTPLPGASPLASVPAAAAPGVPTTPAPTPTPSPLPTPSPVPTPTMVPGATPVPSPGSPLPAPVPGVSASPLPTPTPSPTPTTGIRIFRTDGVARLVKDHLRATTWSDPTPAPGDKPCYSVRYAGSFTPLVESNPTEPVCVEVKDIVPPDAPGQLTGDLGVDFVELSWTASPSADVQFYRLYRSIGGAPRALVIQTEGLLFRVRDTNLASGDRTYEIVAVDRGGNESQPGPLLKITVP
jgi:hypothetical protein